MNEYIVFVVASVYFCVLFDYKDNFFQIIKDEMPINSTLYNLAIEKKHLTELTRQLAD